MSYEKFLEKQNNIYQDFDNGSIKENGANPSKIVLDGKKEYIIAFRYSNHINELISKFSGRIGKEIPIVAYNQEDIHTTISCYNPKEKVEFEPEKEIIDKLADIISPIKGFKAPKINYGSWLNNEDTIIVSGNPSFKFYDLSKKVIEEAENQEIELRMPWGSYITATRFKEKMSPKELESFFKLMKEAPKLGEIKPLFVDIGWYALDKEKFSFNTHKRINLR